MKQARTNYYQNLIEENGSDHRKLFKLSKELLNLNPKQLFPQHSDNYILANSIGSYTTEKITKIRSELDSRPLSCDDLPSTSASPNATLTNFELLSETQIRNLVVSSVRGSCILDPIPASLFNESCCFL